MTMTAPVNRAISIPGRHARPETPLRPWPVVAYFGAFPIWWVLGLAPVMLIVLAVPMAVQLSRRRTFTTPPGFLLWTLFLAWSLFGVVLLGINPEGTEPASAAGRLLGWGFRNLGFVAATVLLLYIGNLTRTELSKSRVVKLLAAMFVFTVAGGVLGLALPHLSFTSPMELLLPSGVRHNAFAQQLFHPSSAQLQDVLSDVAAPRPQAPFEYTNTWGNNLSILLPWFVVALTMTRRRWAQLAGGAVLVAALVPVIYSLNRGLWVGLVLSFGYLVVRSAMAGRWLPLVSALIGATALATVLAATPLGSTVLQRQDAGHSDNIRTDLAERALRLATSSPIVGYGSTRTATGSASTIGVGKSAKCPNCGNAPIGSTGQLWLLLTSAGFVGAGLYFLFFAYPAWRYRRDTSAIGIAGSLVMLLVLLYALFYNSSISTLAIYMTSLALLWRNDADHRRAAAAELAD